MPETPAPAPTAPRRTSRRERRLRLTVYGICGAVIVGLGLAAWLYLASRPEPYRPGEEDAAITRNLARALPPDAPEPRFVDVTEEAGLGGFVHFAGDRTSQLPEDMGSGLAWGDYDRDGDDDLFLVGGGGSLDLPAEEHERSELYENLGDGTFRRDASFPETRLIGMGAAFGDYDGDGWLDLVVTAYGGLRLYRNDAGQMVRDESFPDLPGYWAGPSWGDYDNDGDLDLYVCGYVQYEENDSDRARATMQYGRSVPYTLNPASYDPQPNLLFRNDGEGRFTEVAEQLGVSNPGGRSLSALWLDLDDDGRLDLYVANDISDNAFYRSTGELFEDISHGAWVADHRGAMGITGGDWNRDGDDDLFITHWIAQENALYDSALAGGGAGIPLGSAEAPVRFVDVADQRGLGQVALRLVGWGTEFADLDQDGWLDLIVANGSTFETDETPRGLKPMPMLLLWNQAGNYFHDLAPGDPVLSRPRVARGLALSDYDGDGDLDVALIERGSGVRLLRNEMARGDWLQFRLRNDANRPVLSSRVTLQTTTGSQRRTVSSSSYLSQSSRTVHFGLAAEEHPVGLEVRWPDGTTESWPALATDTAWELTRGRPEAVRLFSSRTPGDGDDDAEKARVVEFWAAQRAAMDALKRDGDCPAAIEQFRRALTLKPAHEDSLYYLANCLIDGGDVALGTVQLEELLRFNPRSHRGLKRLGTLRALQASSPEELEESRELLERALAVNREETGSLLVLGEVDLLRGDAESAAQHLEWACRTNPKAVGGFFLRGYLAYQAGDDDAARALLREARAALGEEWKPEGTTAEGDVAHKMHEEVTPLSRFWESWKGEETPADAFEDLDRFVAEFR